MSRIWDEYIVVACNAAMKGKPYIAEVIASSTNDAIRRAMKMVRNTRSFDTVRVYNTNVIKPEEKLRLIKERNNEGKDK